MASIQGVYVALFGRPADPTGLAYFNSITNNGGDLAKIGDLAASQEYKDRFAGQNNVQIVNSIYKSLFNRDAEATGLTFFVNALNNGTLNVNNIAIAILDGAQGTDKTIVDTKIASANTYTASLDTGSEIVAYSGNAAAAQGRAFLAPISTTAATQAQVDVAIATMVAAGNGGGTGTDGVILTLTNGADVFTPSAALDANKTTAGNDTIRGLADATLGATDIINGGAGTDTLNVSFGATAMGAPVLTSVENVNLTGIAAGGANAFAAGATQGIDLSASTGVNNLTFSNVVLAADATNTGAVVNLSGLSTSTVVTQKDISVSIASGVAADNTNVNVGFTNVGGTNDSAKIVVNNIDTNTAAGILNVNVAGIENLTLESTGSVAGTPVNSAFTLNDAQLTKLTITGNSDLTLAQVAGNTVLKTVDASAFTGVFTYAATNNGETITGGSKADAITLGTGADTIVYNTTNKSTITATDVYTGFDASADKVNLAAFSLGTDTTVGATATSPAADFTGFFTGTNRILFNDATDMVYVDVNKDGNFNAGTDLAFTLTGVAAANLTAADFILA